MEFHANIANLGKYSAGQLAETILSFPATTEQVQAALREIGVDGLRYQEIIILECRTSIRGLDDKIGDFDHIDELNYLASRLAQLTPEQRSKFSAAAEHDEYGGSLQDLINLTWIAIIGSKPQLVFFGFAPKIIVQRHTCAQSEQVFPFGRYMHCRLQFLAL